MFIDRTYDLTLVNTSIFAGDGPKRCTVVRAGTYLKALDPILMKSQRIGDHLICAWAQKINGAFQGLASIAPPIPNSWTGGPEGATLIVNDIHETEARAEDMALQQAIAALLEPQRTRKSG